MGGPSAVYGVNCIARPTNPAGIWVTVRFSVGYVEENQDVAECEESAGIPEELGSGGVAVQENVRTPKLQRFSHPLGDLPLAKYGWV